MRGSSALWLGALLLVTGCAEPVPGGAACGEDCDATDDNGRSRDIAEGEDPTSNDAADDQSVDLGDASPADTSSDAADAADLGGEDGEVPRGGGLVVDPESIYFSTQDVGSIQEQVVIVRNESDQTVVFHAAEVVSSATGFTLIDGPDEASREPGQSIGFTLRYQAPTLDDVNADLVLHHSLGDDVIIPVVVAAKVGEEACISVSPTALTFGPLVRGSGSETHTFTIENCGVPAINVLRLNRGRVFVVMPTPDTFQWTSDPLPISLDAGETTDVAVTFTPGRAGTDRGAVEVVSNVEGSETLRVNLSGTSEVPPLEDLDVHLVLNWDADDSDVDFHFYPTDSELFSCDDCYFSNMSPDWGVADDINDDPFLDYDNVRGYGPENINVTDLGDGTYIIAIHYYSDTGSPPSEGASPTSTNATVEVYLGGVLAETYGPVLLEETDIVWNVAQLAWPSGVLTELGDVFAMSRSDYDFCGGLGF